MPTLEKAKMAVDFLDFQKIFVLWRAFILNCQRSAQTCYRSAGSKNVPQAVLIRLSSVQNAPVRDHAAKVGTGVRGFQFEAFARADDPYSYLPR